MSKYYRGKRTKNLFNPKDKETFKLSRSRIDSFLNCPRCFYIDRRLGVDRPPGFPFSLNSAVDKLLKKEFDLHRAKNQVHPMLKEYGLDLIPFAHEKMDDWRENFKGVQYLHEPTNMLIFGAVDDIWANAPTPSGSPSGRGREILYVADYKATSKDEEVTLDKDWQIGYKRQLEVYQWLLRKNGFKVSNTGYFVYVNGRTDLEAFDGKLEFDVKIIPYKGDDSWVEQAIVDAHKCLMSDKIPKAGADCDYCRYFEARAKAEKNNL